MAIQSADLRGVEGFEVSISATVEPGLPTFTISGMSEQAARETKIRVQAAIQNSGLDWPTGRIAVAIGPPGVTVSGLGLDLPIALAVLGLNNVPCFGELAMNGDVRPVRGALPLAMAFTAPHPGIIVAVDNVVEARLAVANVYGAKRLADAIAIAGGDYGRAPLVSPTAATIESNRNMYHADFSEVAITPEVARALEIAAVGRLNVLLIGEPGAGKTMIARRLTSIMPPPTPGECRSITQVFSAAGLNVGGGLILNRPFRAPHHSCTPPGLVGGGASVPRPGEITLANHGVLMLDEVMEFTKMAIDVLGQAASNREVVLTSARGTLRMPANAWVVATAGPTPCGYTRGSKRCRCMPSDCQRWRERLDRVISSLQIDVVIELPTIDNIELATKGESSVEIQKRVEAASKVYAADEARRPGKLSATSRVARAIAALSGATEVGDEHMAEAVAMAAEGV
jgi:magnesium chelatase family protein